MKLLMENWRSYLAELENIEGVGIPKKFYISIRFGKKLHPTIMKDLSEFKIVKHAGKASSDIVGFADNPSNFMQFHGSIRDATIVMPGKDFAKVNDSVVKMEYDNPDFLTQDGLKALYRLFEKNQDDESHAVRIMSTIIITDDELKKLLNVTGNLEVYHIQQFLQRTYDKTGAALKNNLDKINNFDTFYKVIAPVIMRELEATESFQSETISEYITPEFIKHFLKSGIVKAAKGFEEEREWVVDSNVLNVPPSSIIYIAGPTVKKKELFHRMKKGELTGAEKGVLSFEIEKMNAIMSDIEEYGLDTKYKKVIITDMGTFNAAKNKWEKKQREMKYELEKQQEMPQAAQ